MATVVWFRRPLRDSGDSALSAGLLISAMFLRQWRVGDSFAGKQGGFFVSARPVAGKASFWPTAIVPDMFDGFAKNANPSCYCVVTS
ncbi:MAG: hypothetical protein OEV91_07290 [Desulfobulbaceae bacterium]|nr:hypothetical protein [Desulfobulbaceae bacterium]